MIPKDFAELVVDWFRREGRLLPWREGRDPYRIWISEVMLQQTRIEAVIPYYHRFLATLPDVAALARCPEEKLLKLWEGLGYYSRARNLKKAAVKVMDTFGGEMPRTAKELQSLSGIGDYTAGAISSIAFGEREPAVDGNVLRVMTRVLGDEGDIALPETKKRIAALLKEIYPEGRAAGDLTEGIMELGERVCIPNGVPLCSLCPVKEICRGYGEGLWKTLPVKSPKKDRKKVKMSVFVLFCDGKYALRKRGEEGLLAGMWEFYHEEGHLTLPRAREALEKAGMEVERISSTGSAKHIFTHLEWEMRGFFATLKSPVEGLVWLSPEEIREGFALPGAFRYFREQIK